MLGLINPTTVHPTTHRDGDIFPGASVFDSLGMEEESMENIPTRMLLELKRAWRTKSRNKSLEDQYLRSV